MPSIIARILLFLSSYFPLFVIFFCLYIGKNTWFAISCLGFGVLGLWGFWRFWRYMRKHIGPEKIQVVTIRSDAGESMSYIVSYIIPFLSISTNEQQQQFALGVFFFMIAVLYVTSNMIHVNPMLSLLGYRIYEITLSTGSPHTLISRRRIIPNQSLKVVKVSENLFVESKE